MKPLQRYEVHKRLLLSKSIAKDNRAENSKISAKKVKSVNRNRNFQVFVYVRWRRRE